MSTRKNDILDKKSFKIVQNIPYMCGNMRETTKKEW